jgi:RNA polymerase sigma factor for flagellar operon FliA
MGAGNVNVPCLTTEQTSAERERLILDHLPQVRLIARRIHERLPVSVGLEDLVSSGILGLISAIDNFDLCQNVKLRTYAEYKIRGAILDSLRGLDWAPRDKRRKAKQIEAAIAAVEQRVGRAANEEEVAAALGLAVNEYRGWLVEVQGLTLNSLEFEPEGGRNLLELLSADERNLPSKLLENSELERLLARATSQIPAAEREVLSLYYEQDLTLREIAEIMDVHLSRISQLKSQAILRLRAQMKRVWPVRRGR